MTTPDDDADQTRQRRPLRAATVTALLLALPSLLASVAIVVVAAVLVTRGAGLSAAGLVVVGWLLSGLVALWPRTEATVAGFVLGLRRPTADEQLRLESAWQEGRQRAGIKNGPYSLWVEISDDLSATVGAPYAITITRWALRTADSAHLQALVAQALGHHLAHHPLLSSLTHWYSLPARVPARFVRLLTRTSTMTFCFVVAVAVPVAFGCSPTFLIAGLWLPLVHNVLPACLVIVVLGSIQPTLAWSDRRSERHADEQAAQLGYRRQLAAALHERMYVDEIARAHMSIVARLTTHHASPRDRILSLGTQDIQDDAAGGSSV